MNLAILCSACSLKVRESDLEDCLGRSETLCYACRALAGEFGDKKRERAEAFERLRRKAAERVEREP